MICPKDGKDCACNVIIGRTICDPPERSGDEFAAMARDAERLDWLDDLNKKFNERTGTTYGWKLDWTCNRWALSDCNLPALTVREAIDAAMAERNKEKS